MAHVLYVYVVGSSSGPFAICIYSCSCVLDVPQRLITLHCRWTVFRPAPYLQPYIRHDAAVAAASG
jgi:hypothetical protein